MTEELAIDSLLLKDSMLKSDRGMKQSLKLQTAATDEHLNEVTERHGP